MPSYVTQATFPTRQAIGLIGQVLNEEKSVRISRTVESDAGIAFGQPSFRGSNDHGVIVGGTFAATGAGTADARNTGTGAITASPAITAGAKAGRYTAVLVGTSATAPYLVYDPAGILVGDGIVATANTTITGITTFTIANAGTMTTGDTYYIDVTYTANTAFMGFAVLTPYYQAPTPGGAAITDGYPIRSTGSFMLEGQTLVLAGASVADGDQVYWNPATTRYTNTTTHILIPGARFDTASTDGNPVEVSIRNRVA